WIARIRNKNNQYFLTFKGITKTEGAWSEAEVNINENEAKILKLFFLSNNFVKEVEIVKNRKSFKISDLTLNIDSIKNLGNFVEVEKMTTLPNVNIVKKEITKFFGELGMDKIEHVNKG